MPKKKKKAYTSRSLKKHQREAEKKKEEKKKQAEAEKKRRRTGSSFDTDSIRQDKPIRGTAGPVFIQAPIYIQRAAGKNAAESDMYGRMGRIMMNALIRMGVSEKAIRRTMKNREAEDRWSANDAEYLRVKNEKQRAKQQAFLSRMPEQMALDEEGKKLRSTEQKKGRRDERSLDQLGQSRRPRLEALTEEELPSRPKRGNRKRPGLSLDDDSLKRKDAGKNPEGAAQENKKPQAALENESPENVQAQKNPGEVPAGEPKVNDLGSVEEFLGEKEPEVKNLGSVEEFLGEKEPEVKNLGTVEEFLGEKEPEVKNLGSVEEFLGEKEPEVKNLGTVEEFLGEKEPEVKNLGTVEEFLGEKEPEVKNLGTVEEFLGEKQPEEASKKEPEVKNLGSVEEFLGDETGKEQQKGKNSLADIRREGFSEEPEELYKASGYADAESRMTAERPMISPEEGTEISPGQSRQLTEKRRDSAQIAEKMSNYSLLRKKDVEEDDETKELLDALRETGMQSKEKIGQAVDEVMAYPIGELVGSSDKGFAVSFGEYQRIRRIRESLTAALSDKRVMYSLGGPLVKKVWEFLKREDDFKKLDDYADARLELLTTPFYAGTTMQELNRWRGRMKEMLSNLGKDKLSVLIKGNPARKKALHVITMMNDVERLEAACGDMVRAENEELEKNLAAEGGLLAVPDDLNVEEEFKKAEQELDDLHGIEKDGEKLEEMEKEGELTEEDVQEIMGEPDAPKNDAEVDEQMQDLEGEVEQEHAGERERLKEIFEEHQKERGRMKHEQGE